MKKVRVHHSAAACQQSWTGSGRGIGIAIATARVGLGYYDLWRKVATESEKIT